MLVKIAPLGEKVTEVSVNDTTTVGDALAIANVDVNGRSIRLNNIKADESTVISTENSVITLALKMKGGK